MATPHPRVSGSVGLGQSLTVFSFSLVAAAAGGSAAGLGSTLWGPLVWVIPRLRAEELFSGNVTMHFSVRAF